MAGSCGWLTLGAQVGGEGRREERGGEGREREGERRGGGGGGEGGPEFWLWRYTL